MCVLIYVDMCLMLWAVWDVEFMCVLNICGMVACMCIYGSWVVICVLCRAMGD